MKNKFLLLLVFTSVLLTACGGSSDSGFDESLAQEREAVECVDFGVGTIINSCDFAIIVVVFNGVGTPISVPANGVADNPEDVLFATFGACRSPFTPVELDASEFECL